MKAEEVDARERVNDRKQRQEQADDAFDAVVEMVAFTVVTEAQSAAFRERLTTYDVATIEALQANTEALQVVAEEREALLDKAHVLGDGRRVFETKDGLRVFDENGHEVAADVITAAEIGNNRPKWERFEEVSDRHAVLHAEHAGLLAFQEKLDAMNERFDAGDVSTAEMEKFEATLDDAAPAALDAYLPQRPDATGPRETGWMPEGFAADRIAEPVIGLEL